MIQRFFHPVGQGAFYSERHTSHNINIVYDCGTAFPKTQAKERVVDQCFKKDEVIHILFISHFDYDHISLIDKLKKTIKSIERVVIPLLHDEEKIFLSGIFRALKEDHLANLVSNPAEYFGKGTKVILVQPGDEKDSEEKTSPLDISEIQRPTKEVASGRPLTIKGLNDWVYIPFNYEFSSRSKEFQEQLSKAGIPPNQLRTDPNLLASKHKEIKKIYKKISGNINENSMFLYSGPLREKDSNIYYWRRIACWSDTPCLPFNYCVHPHYSDKVACLYTGDGDLNKAFVKNIYKRYWNLIGTIQIPHHGSLQSFHPTILDEKYFLCPISVGKNNLYGHPSQKVISEILSNRSCPILVTEDVDSTFVEIIEDDI